MIWATTQHYADFIHQVETLNGGAPLSDEQFATARENVVRIVLSGVGIRPKAGARAEGGDSPA
ncbi:TetR family transcriptional regulator C-terminal domain-containing protein [Pannonibacter sp. Pt2-lr]